MQLSTFLKKHGDSPEIELLAACILGQDRGWLLAHLDTELTLWQRLHLAYVLWLYRRGWSIAHITHHKEFYGLDFYVNRHTLVPRPETEMMADEVARLRTSDFGLQPMLIDIGTGSGCIPISILKKTILKPVHTYAIDISHRALKVAKKNASNHGVDITFLQGNLLAPLAPTMQQYSNLTIILTANLPYLTRAQFTTERSIQKEPYTALVADENGLALYHELLQQLKKALAGKRITLYGYFEIDPQQTNEITRLITSYLPEATVTIRKDLCGRDRIASFKLG